MDASAPDAMEELKAVVTDLQEAEDAVQILEQRLDEIVLGLRDRIEDHDKLMQAASYVYWMVPSVKVKTIAQGVFGNDEVRQVLQVIPAVSAGISCERCAREIPVTSRTNFQELMRELRRNRRFPNEYGVVCNDCRAKIMAGRWHEQSQCDAAWEARLRELRAMPYREYLLTPEWEDRRARHLRSAGYRCQVCNAGGTRLDVHHRTYERLGEELFKDLVVLCNKCHELFHREGRLSHE